MCVLISRKAAIEICEKAIDLWDGQLGSGALMAVKENIQNLPSVQPESLTDKEQRIFLAAMGREEKVCKEVDENLPLKEPYEDSLVQICREIVRKVKGALWTS